MSFLPFLRLGTEELGRPPCPLFRIAISLGGDPGPLTHEWGSQEPPEAEAAKLCGMEVCLLSLRVQMPSSALLQGTHTCWQVTGPTLATWGSPVLSKGKQ